MASPEDMKGEGFEILGHQDREPSTPEEQETPSQAKEPEREAEQESRAPSADAGAQAAEEQLRPLDVYAVLRISIAQLAGAAWQMMGLQADPFTSKIRKDIGQARIAIDAAGALIDKLLPHVKDQEARDYQNLLTDLRLNFVKQSGEKPEKQ